MTTYGFNDITNILYLADRIFDGYTTTRNNSLAVDFAGFLSGLQCLNDWHDGVVAQNPPLSDDENRTALIAVIKSNYTPVASFMGRNT